MSETEPVAPVPRRGVNTKVIAAIVVVAAFLTGALAGAVADRFWMIKRRIEGGPPPHATRFILNRLDHQLDLTDEQRAKIGPILDRAHVRIRVIMDETHPRVRTEIEKTNAEIEAILTPEQRAKFETLKMRLMMRRHVPGPPPHPPHTH